MAKVVIILKDEDLGNPEVVEALKALLEALGGDEEGYYEEGEEYEAGAEEEQGEPGEGEEE